MVTRRSFLKTTAVASAGLLVGPSLFAKSKSDYIGVQLYTVRTVLPQEPAKVLGAIEAIGYKEVECTWAGIDKLMPAIHAAKLKPTSIHLDSTVVTKGSDDDLNKMLDEPFKIFTFSPAAVSVYQLGNYGTARKQLKTWNFKSE